VDKLIVMPGTPEFAETTKVVDLASRRTKPLPVPDESLVGRTLMLNLAVCRGFQCGGFQLSLHRSFAVVDDKAQQTPIRTALADGRLVDITGQDPKKGFKTKEGAVSKVEQSDTGLQAFVGRTAKGEFFVAIPKNKTQAKQYAREVQRTGTLKTDPDQTTHGLSGITTEDIPLDAQGCLILPGSQPTRGKTSGRTNRPQRQSRRR
jgi:hypothetical protein